MYEILASQTRRDPDHPALTTQVAEAGQRRRSRPCAFGRHPAVRGVGLSLNTSRLSAAEAEGLLADTSHRLRLPAMDPMREGVERVADALVGV